MDVVTHVWEQGGTWVTSFHYLKGASSHLRSSQNVLCSTGGTAQGGDWEKWGYKDSPPPARAQLGASPVLRKTQEFC